MMFWIVCELVWKFHCKISIDSSKVPECRRTVGKYLEVHAKNKKILMFIIFSTCRGPHTYTLIPGILNLARQLDESCSPGSGPIVSKDASGHIVLVTAGCTLTVHYNFMKLRDTSSIVRKQMLWKLLWKILASHLQICQTPTHRLLARTGCKPRIHQASSATRSRSHFWVDRSPRSLGRERSDHSVVWGSSR